MKTMKCDKCEESFAAESFEGWFGQMHGHYMEVHQDVMKANEGKSKEDGARWMADAKKRFDELA